MKTLSSMSSTSIIMSQQQQQQQQQHFKPNNSNTTTTTTAVMRSAVTTTILNSNSSVNNLNKPHILAAESVSELRAKAKQFEQLLTSSSSNQVNSTQIAKSSSNTDTNKLAKEADYSATLNIRRRSIFMSQDTSHHRPVVVLLNDQTALQKFHNPRNPNCLFSPIRTESRVETREQQLQKLKSLSANSLIDELNFYENLHLYENQPIKNKSLEVAEKGDSAKNRSKSIDTNLNETNTKQASSSMLQGSINNSSKFYFLLIFNHSLKFQKVKADFCDFS
jgi:hypothetical protein